LAKLAAIISAATLLMPHICEAGIIGDRCDAGVEQACLAQIGEEVNITFVRHGTCFGDSTAAEAYAAASVADTAVSYTISLVEGEQGWEIWSISKRLRVAFPGKLNPVEVALYPGVDADVGRRCITAVLPLIEAAETISSVGLTAGEGPLPGEFEVHTLDESKQAPGGRVFCIAVEDGEYVAKLTGWGVF